MKQTRQMMSPWGGFRFERHPNFVTKWIHSNVLAKKFRYQALILAFFVSIGEYLLIIDFSNKKNRKKDILAVI